MHLIDTDWVISFLNGRQNAITLFAELSAQDRLAVSTITWGEVDEGVVGSEDVPARKRQFDGFVATVEVLPVDVAVAARDAALRLQLRRERALLADNDLWIAATALAHGLTLVSRDRHFGRIPGLSLHGPDGQ